MALPLGGGGGSPLCFLANKSLKKCTLFFIFLLSWGNTTAPHLAFAVHMFRRLKSYQEWKQGPWGSQHVDHLQMDHHRALESPWPGEGTVMTPSRWQHSHKGAWGHKARPSVGWGAHLGVKHRQTLGRPEGLLVGCRGDRVSFETKVTNRWSVKVLLSLEPSDTSLLSVGYMDTVFTSVMVKSTLTKSWYILKLTWTLKLLDQVGKYVVWSPGHFIRTFIGSVTSYPWRQN